MPAVIRRAQDGDEAQVADFAIRLFRQHADYDPGRFTVFATPEGAKVFYKSRFSAPDAVVFVAESEGEVVGFAYIERDPLNYAELLENGAWLHDIYIRDESRSEGTGRALLDAAIEAAKELGAKKLLLSVAAKNFAARSFFEGAGFRVTMHEMTMDIGESL